MTLLLLRESSALARPDALARPASFNAENRTVEAVGADELEAVVQVFDHAQLQQPRPDVFVRHVVDVGVVAPDANAPAVLTVLVSDRLQHRHRLPDREPVPGIMRGELGSLVLADVHGFVSGPAVGDVFLGLAVGSLCSWVRQ